MKLMWPYLEGSAAGFELSASRMQQWLGIAARLLGAQIHQVAGSLEGNAGVEVARHG